MRPIGPGVDPGRRGSRLRRGGQLGLAAGLGHLLAGGVLEPGELVARQQALLEDVALEPGHRVAPPGALDLLARPVDPVVVVGGVGHEPVRLGLDERGALAGPGPGHGGLGGGVDVEDVVAVDHHAVEAVGGGPVGHVGHRRLLPHPDGDGVAVVLAHEDGGQPVDAREVERLVEVALRGRRLAEPGDGDLVVAPDGGGQGQAGGVGELGADGRRAGDDPEPARAPVVRHLATPGVGVVALGQHGQEDLIRRHAQGEDHADVAVVREGDVVAGPQRPCRADLGGLLALGGDVEPGLAVAGEVPGLLVDEPGQEDGAVHPDHVVGRQPELDVTGRRDRPGLGPLVDDLCQRSAP